MNHILRACFVHLAFHTAWVILYMISLLGVYLLIPIFGLYFPLVLGFLGAVSLTSIGNAALFGYLVFAFTGFISGLTISALRLNSRWMPSLLSLCLTLVLMISASVARFTFIGIPNEITNTLPSSAGSDDVVDLVLAIKSDYHLNGEVPPYFSDKEPLIRLSEIKQFQNLKKDNTELNVESYIYYNLPAQAWRHLKETEIMPRYPIFWSATPDLNGLRVVVLVNLKTDIFDDELMDSNEFLNIFSKMTKAVGDESSYTK
jgi:hypothetical protein